MGEFEAVGEVVTGAMAARVVEPRAGEVGADGHTREQNCLNCGSPLVGEYCHACGQHSHVHRTITAFFHDLIHGVLHFEGKVWTTLPMLAWKPGELTRRYIDGERAKFVSPIALFLFGVFLMFALASATGGISSPTNVEVRRELSQEAMANERQLAELQKQRDEVVRKGEATATLDGRIAKLQRETAVLRGVERGELRTVEGMNLSPGMPDWIRQPIEKAGQNPELLFYKLKTNAYKFSWALIPLSVPFLWLLFPFSRKFRLYDHTVFVTYSLSFMTLLVVAGILFGLAGMAPLVALLFLIPPIHMYRHLKGTYGLGRAGAMLRTFLLLSFAAVALGFFGLFLVTLGMLD